MVIPDKHTNHENNYFGVGIEEENEILTHFNWLLIVLPIVVINTLSISNCINIVKIKTLKVESWQFHFLSWVIYDHYKNNEVSTLICSWNIINDHINTWLVWLTNFHEKWSIKNVFHKFQWTKFSTVEHKLSQP